jgi:mRNA interferase RelE/StbE
MYEIIIENKVKKQIESVNKTDSLKIIDSIEKLKGNPRPRACTKLEVFEGYRIRVGDFRVLYTISD